MGRKVVGTLLGLGGNWEIGRDQGRDLVDGGDGVEDGTGGWQDSAVHYRDGGGIRTCGG